MKGKKGTRIKWGKERETRELIKKKKKKSKLNKRGKKRMTALCYRFK